MRFCFCKTLVRGSPHFFLGFSLTSVCEKTSLTLTNITKNSCHIHYDFLYLVMQHIQGISRQQVQLESLEDKISVDNSVQFIVAFVGVLDMEKLGFTVQTIKKRRFARVTTHKYFLKSTYTVI